MREPDDSRLDCDVESIPGPKDPMAADPTRMGPSTRARRGTRRA